MAQGAGGLVVEDFDLEAAGHSFTVRVYRPAEPARSVFVWAHGGGFLGGSLDMPEADETARMLAAGGVAVVSVGYSLAPADMLLDLPEHARGPNVPSREQIEAEIAASGPRVHYPVASLQLLEAFDWAVAHAEEFGADASRVAIGGASAGGNLAGGVALRLRDRAGSLPCAVLLCYPVLHAAPLDGSGDGPDPARDLQLNYVGDPRHLADPYAFPGGHDLAGLTSTVIVTAEHDGLRASGQAYAAELASAGVDVQLVQQRGAAHGFLNLIGSPAAADTVAVFVAALDRAAD